MLDHQRSLRNQATEADAGSASPILRIRDAAVGYGPLVVLSIDDLEVQPGEVIAIVGQSGIGKSTLLRSLAGLQPLLAGHLELDGQLAGAPARVQNTALIQQHFPLFPWLTVADNLAAAARIRRSRGLDIPGTLARFSASHLAHRYPRELSGGERCRASLAQAVVAHPRLLLLDEPFSGLDSLTKSRIASTIMDLTAERDIGVLLVTHDLGDVVQLASRALIIGSGPPAKRLAQVNPRTAGALQLMHSILEADYLERTG